MRVVEIKDVQPRNCATHGLFGVKFLKRHNFRDLLWTANDLIEQYQRLSTIYRKDNAVKKLKREQDEMKEEIEYENLKDQLRERLETLEVFVKGDVQRTNNILMKFPKYMRMFQKKRSDEVLESLEFQSFLMTKEADRCMARRQRMMTTYEDLLMNLAYKQEIIDYYDVKEFQQERDKKRIYVELKNSETRWRASEKLNRTYKSIIEQLLHDELFYQPVLDALNDDWKEQSRLIQEAFNIGYPTINKVHEIGKNAENLKESYEIEKKMRLRDVESKRVILSKFSKNMKDLIRSDSDFIHIDDRYERETRSMTSLRLGFEEADRALKKLLVKTFLCTPDKILPRLKQKLEKERTRNEVRRHGIEKLTSLTEEQRINAQIYDTMLEDHPDLVNEEFLHKIASIQRASVYEEEKAKQLEERIHQFKHASKLMIGSMLHVLEVLRHVEPTTEPRIDREYPNELMKLNLLKFNSDLPPEPKVIDVDSKSITLKTKQKVHALMSYVRE